MGENEMVDLIETRQSIPPSLTVRQLWRERILYLIVMGLVMALLASGGLIVLLKYQGAEERGIYRTEEELVSGGKRFVDYFYSLNSATVEGDQFRAISMMINEADREARLQYIVEIDLVRKTQQARMKSEIDWIKSEATIVGRGENGVLHVEYKAWLIRNDVTAGMLDILLRLVAVEKSDINTDGVGVLEWIDIAENPFEVKDAH
ncbi:MAG: hypothetical protein KUG81_10530 [Gammaproteobacteria bacterium]|nr:hypothetical protein [Gammaproteobacteria bacterium]